MLIQHTQLSHSHLASTHSTNSQLIDWITQSFKNKNTELLGEILDKKLHHFSQPHLLTADTQTSGRGQHGRQWQSPLGNVYLSLYIPTTEFAEDKNFALKQRLDGRLSLCVGYQLSQISEIKALQKIGVKWVNDIGFYESNQFHKLSGILIEPVSVDNKLLGVVIGVGMNIAFAPTLTNQTQKGLNYKAVCLQDLLGQTLNPHEFYQPISHAILQAIEQFNGFIKPSHVAEFLQKFHQIDIVLGKKLQISLPNNEKITGTGQSIDKNGCLQILQHDGTITPIWTGTLQVLIGL